MITRYIVAYDVTADARRNKLLKVLKGAGTRLQFSVFQCDLSERGLQELITDVTKVINAKEDQVLFVNLGPAEGRAPKCVRALGRAYACEERKAIII